MSPAVTPYSPCSAAAISRRTVDVDRYERGQFRRIPLRQHGEQHAGEHVAAPCGSHCWASRRVEVDLAVGAHNGGVSSLEDNQYVVILCHLYGLAQTGLGRWLRAEKTVEFPACGVRIDSTGMVLSIDGFMAMQLRASASSMTGWLIDARKSFTAFTVSSLVPMPDLRLWR